MELVTIRAGSNVFQSNDVNGAQKLAFVYRKASVVKRGVKMTTVALLFFFLKRMPSILRWRAQLVGQAAVRSWRMPFFLSCPMKYSLRLL